MTRLRTLFLTAGLVLVSGLAVGFAAANLPRLAALAAERYLAAEGFPEARVAVSSIGLTETVVGPVSLDGAGTLDVGRLRLVYSLSRLAGQRLDGIAVDGLRWRAGISAAGLDLGPLERFRAGGDGQTGWRVVGPVEVSDARATLATPFGPVAAAVDAKALLTDGLGDRFEGRFTLRHADGEAVVAARALVGPDGAMSGHYRIEQARSDRADAAFAALSGAGTFDWPAGGRPAGEAAFSLEGVGARGLDLGRADLKARLEDGRLDLAGGLSRGNDLAVDFTAAVDDVVSPATPLRVGVEVSGDRFPGLPDLPGGMTLAGRATASLRGRLDAVLAAGRALARGEALPAVEAAGRVDVDFLTFETPDGGPSGLAGGAFDLRLADGELAVAAARPVEVELERGLPEPLLLRLTADDAAPLATLGPLVPGPVGFSARFETTGGGLPDLRGRVGGAAEIDAAGRPWFSGVEARLDDFAWRGDGVAVSVGAPTATVSGDPENWSAGIAVGLAVEAAAGLATFPVEARVEGVGGRLEVRPEGCLVARVTELEVGETVVEPGPVTVCPPAGGLAMFAVAPGRAGGRRIEVRGSLNSGEASIAPAGGPRLLGAYPRVDAEAVYETAASAWTARLAATGGRLRIVDAGLVLTGLEAAGRFSGIGAGLPTGSLDLGALRLAFSGEPPPSRPLDLGGRLEMADGVAAFSGVAAYDDGLRATVAGRHDLAAATGQASFELPEIAFGPAAPSPAELWPVLRGKVADAVGAVDAAGSFAWGPDGVSSRGRVRARGLGFGTEAAEVADLAADVELESLWPPKTRGPQKLTVGRLDAGLPLSGGEITFAVDDAETFRLLSARWPVAGGWLEAEPATLRLGEPPPALAVRVDGIDLAGLLEIAAVEGLSATGAVTGRIPVRFEDATPIVDDAAVTASGGGVIRYVSEDADAVLASGGGHGEMLARALRDFRYTSFEVGFKGPLTGAITARLRLAGSNPGLYEGKAIELNVDLQGDLRDVLQSASVFRKLPEDIRRQMGGGGANRETRP